MDEVSSGDYVGEFEYEIDLLFIKYELNRVKDTDSILSEVQRDRKLYDQKRIWNLGSTNFNL